MSAYMFSAPSIRAHRSMSTQSPKPMTCELAGVGSKCGSAPCSFTATIGPSGASIPSSRNRDRMNSATSYSVGRTLSRSPIYRKAS